MSHGIASIMARMIYGRPTASKTKPIPAEPDVKSYDPLKSLIDSRSNRTKPRRTPRQYNPDNCQICGKVLAKNETYVCRHCDEEPLQVQEFEQIGRVRVEEQE